MGVFTLGGGNSNGKSDVDGNSMEWGWIPICDGNGKKEEIYVYNIMPLPMLPPQCEHPHWTPLDPFTNNVIAVAADTPQCEHSRRKIILPLPLPSLSVNEPLAEERQARILLAPMNVSGMWFNLPIILL